MKKWVPYLLLVPQIVLTVLFMIGLITGITQSFGVIPAFELREPTLRYYKEILIRPDMLKSVLYSIRIAFLSAGIATVGGVLLCLCLCENRKDKGKGTPRNSTADYCSPCYRCPVCRQCFFTKRHIGENGVCLRLDYGAAAVSDVHL